MTDTGRAVWERLRHVMERAELLEQRSQASQRLQWLQQWQHQLHRTGVQSREHGGHFDREPGWVRQHRRHRSDRWQRQCSDGGNGPLQWAPAGDADPACRRPPRRYRGHRGLLARSPQRLDAMETAAARLLERDVQDGLREAQADGADVFGLGGMCGSATPFIGLGFEPTGLPAHSLHFRWMCGYA